MWKDTYLPILTVVLLCVRTSYCGGKSGDNATPKGHINTPKGHMKPLDYLPPIHGIATMDHFPSPKYFYEWFVKTGQPVLLKSVLNTIDFPAYKKWTDDYIREKYGHLEVTIEHGKKETRDPEGVSFSKMSSFLDTYLTSDIYMVKDISDNPMLDDIPLVPCLQCGGFQRVMNTMVMWFSSGGTKSVLHFDSFDNINCLLAGTKDMMFIDKIHTDRIKASEFAHDRGYSKVDVDNVDLTRFPGLKDLPWMKAQMNQGDCLFIPNHWFHQVNSYGNRNLAVNFWFDHLPWFNNTDCDDSTNYSSKPVFYDQEDEDFTDRLFVQSTFSGMESVRRDEMQRIFKDQLQLQASEIDKVFDFLDGDSDGEITWSELAHFDFPEFLKQFGHQLEAMWPPISKNPTETTDETTTRTKDEF